MEFIPKQPELPQRLSELGRPVPRKPLPERVTSFSLKPAVHNLEETFGAA